MDYEKAYKEAIESLKRIYDQVDSYGKELMEKEFPELADSDRIRKELLEHCINRRDGKQVCVDASDYRRWADWLEKQGEQMLAWSEEDELGFKQAIYVCHRYGYTDVENWLKTMKKRMKGE